MRLYTIMSGSTANIITDTAPLANLSLLKISGWSVKKKQIFGTTKLLLQLELN